MSNPLPEGKFVCPKCSHTEYKEDFVRMTGSGLSRLFNLQNKKYTAISCKNCGFTELYRQDSSTAGNVIDVLFGG